MSTWGDSWGIAWGGSWDRGGSTALHDRWADVISLNTDQRGRLAAIIEADRIDAIATGNRSELLADHGRIE